MEVKTYEDIVHKILNVEILITRGHLNSLKHIDVLCKYNIGARETIQSKKRLSSNIKD